jgi:hypothetical protein
MDEEKMKKQSPTEGPLVVHVERDLRKHMRAISQRLNANPNLAKLVLINPLLVLEDLGVEVSKEVKTHIIETLRFPPALVKRREALAVELKKELAAIGVHHALPLTIENRAALVFHTLKIKPLPEDVSSIKKLSVNQLRSYKDQHPLLTKIAEYERYSKGALIFYPRSIYEQYKAGEKMLHWVNAIRFKV